MFKDHSIPGEAPHGKRCVYDTMIKTLCLIHRIDLKTTGLENLKDPGRTFAIFFLFPVKNVNYVNDIRVLYNILYIGYYILYCFVK